jgi:hypothetical protein
MHSCCGAQAKKAWQGDKIKDLRVPWGALQLIEEVGSGGYGTVYKARWAGSEVAVKKLSATAVTERVRKELEREAYIMSTLFHPNVARFYGTCPHVPSACPSVLPATLLAVWAAQLTGSWVTASHPSCRTTGSLLAGFL